MRPFAACARAALAADLEAYSHRRYVAEALRLLTESAARVAGGQYLTGRWGDAPARRGPERTPEDAARDIIRGAGLKYGGR